MAAAETAPPRMEAEGLKVDPEKVVEFLRGEVADAERVLQTSRYMLLYRYQMAVTTARALNMLDRLPVAEITATTLASLDRRTWLFGGYPGSDGHVLYTLNGLQVLLQTQGLSGLSREEIKRISDAVKGLRCESGIYGDLKTKELDSRFLVSAVSALRILELYTGDPEMNFSETEKDAIAS